MFYAFTLEIVVLFIPIMLKKIGVEGSSCNNNVDCKSALVCDGNLNECRQTSSHHTTDHQFCSRDGRLCQEMEGDCDHDNECAGSLKCGTDNCGSAYGGDWDCCAQPGDAWTYILLYHSKILNKM